MITTFNELIPAAHGLAIEKGWHPAPASPDRFGALIALAISECVELDEHLKPWPIKPRLSERVHYLRTGGTKPEGVAPEMADVVIRLADLYGLMGWKLQDDVKLNAPYAKYSHFEAPTRHIAYDLILSLTHVLEAFRISPTFTLEAAQLPHVIINRWALWARDMAGRGIHVPPLGEVIREKHAYNMTRPTRHGGKVL